MMQVAQRGTGRRQVRGLAHTAHWQGPQGALFERFGAVKATPRAAFRLLQSGEAVLLFPGGGREVRARIPKLHAPLKWALSVPRLLQVA